LTVLIIFSNGLSVYFPHVVNCFIREMPIVSKALAKPTTEKKFFGSYRELSIGSKILSR